MKSITKKRAALFFILISLVLSTSNIKYTQKVTEDRTGLLDVNTDRKVFDQIEIKSSGDNDYTEVWSSINSELRSLDNVHSGDLDMDGKKEIIVEAGNVFKVFEYNSTYNNYTKVWSKTLGTFYTMCTGDQDGDGKKEIIGGGSGNILYICEYSGSDNGYISVRNQSTGHTIRGIGVGEDLDKDGKREIIIGGWVPNEYKLYIYEFNGTDNGYDQVWVSGVTFGQFSQKIICSVEDLDGDGKKEIIFGDSANKLYIYENDGTDDGYEQVWNSSSIIGDWVYDVCIGDDLDGDGKKEIIASSILTDDKVYVFEYNGTDNGYSKIWDSSSMIGDDVNNVCFGNDLDGDGKKEIIAGSMLTDDKVYVFEYNGTDNGYSNVWNSDFTIKSDIKGLSIGEDHNSNGKLEIIISTDNKFYIFEHEEPVPSTIIIDDDDDDDDNGEDKEGFYISTQSLIIGGVISAIAIIGIAIIIIKRRHR
jgi:hypothetical protein